MLESKPNRMLRSLPTAFLNQVAEDVASRLNRARETGEDRLLRRNSGLLRRLENILALREAGLAQEPEPTWITPLDRAFMSFTQERIREGRRI